MTKKCPSCGHENPDDAEYCEGCGLRLQLSQPAAQPQAQSVLSQPAAQPQAQSVLSQPAAQPQAQSVLSQPAAQVEAAKPIAKLILPTGEEIPITSFPRMFGRADFLRLQNSEYISRRHFEISYENDKFYIEDLGSTNGTSVNGNRITTKTEIKDGDTIELAGLVSIKFKAS